MLYLAHRGCNRLALENTLAAFEFAVETGHDGVELDVQLSKDRIPVVFHDDTLERLYGMKGRVQDLTAEEAARLVPVNAERFDVDPARMGIPRLDEVIRVLPDDGFLINVEIKAPRLKRDTPTAATAQVLSDFSRDFLVSSFNPVELARYSRIKPGAALGYLFAPDAPLGLRIGWPAPALKVAGLSAIHPHWSLISPNMIERAHSRGWKVNTWTLNDADRAVWLSKDGLDAVISDDHTLKDTCKELLAK
jgi:glycerophosphoryl diester phosphodiesterase